jgi:hypothetical protein
MEIKNFRVNDDYYGISPRRAKIDVTTGALWWKRTETIDIFNSPLDGYWRSLKDGTPMMIIGDSSERAYEANKVFSGDSRAVSAAPTSEWREPRI